MHRLAGFLIVDIIAEHARDGLPTQRAIRAVMILGRRIGSRIDRSIGRGNGGRSIASISVVTSLGLKGSGRVVECC